MFWAGAASVGSRCDILCSRSIWRSRGASRERSKLPICSTVQPSLLGSFPSSKTLNWTVSRESGWHPLLHSPPPFSLFSSLLLYENKFACVKKQVFFGVTWNHCSATVILLFQGQISAHVDVNMPLRNVSRSISFYSFKAFKAAAESLCFTKLFSKVFLSCETWFSCLVVWFAVNLGSLSAVAQMFYKLFTVASGWGTSQFPAPAARRPVCMCTVYLNPRFSSHAEILQGLICCCLSSLDVSWPTLYSYDLFFSPFFPFLFLFSLKQPWSATTQGQMNGRTLPKWMSHITATRGRCTAVTCIFQVRCSQGINEILVFNV